MTAAFVALRTEPLSVDEAIARVGHAGAGAVSVFVGMVRDHRREPDGSLQPVVGLEYEAYTTMAEAEMRRIAEDIVREIPGVRLAAIHRTGWLSVGGVAVVCAASAPHRAEAFGACRELIDRIKARVPIWKREHGPGGAFWVGWEDARCAADPDHDHTGGS
jgi:molybdopterin synthase catalytic subunit